MPYSIYNRRKKVFYDQKPDASVSIEVNNPIVDPDHTARAFALSLNFPPSVKNDAAFQHAYRFDDAQPRTADPITIVVDNAPLIDANMSLTDISTEGYATTLKNDERELLDKLNDLKLSDVLGTFTMPTTRQAYDEWRIVVQNLPLDDNGAFWRITIGTNEFEAYPNHDPFAHLTTLINNVYPNLCTPYRHLEYLTLRSNSTIPLDPSACAYLVPTHRPRTATIAPPQYVFQLADPDPQQGYIVWQIRLGSDLFEFDSNETGVLLKFHNAINAKYPNLSIYNVQNEFNRMLVLSPLSADVDKLVNATLSEYNPDVLLISMRSFAEYEAEIVASFIQDNYENDTLPFCFPLVHNPLFYEGKAAYKGFVNEVSHIMESGILPQTAKDMEMSTLVPFVRYVHVLEKIGEKIGLPVAGELISHAEFRQIHVYNVQSIDKAAEWQIIGSQTRFVNSYKSTFALSDHLPDMSAKEFVNQFCEGFGQSYRLKDGQLRFYYKMKQIAQPRRNWTPRLVTGSEKIEWKDRKGFKIKLTTDQNDTTAHAQHYDIGKAGDFVILPFGVTAVGNATYTDSYGVSQTVFCMKTTQRGNSRSDILRLVFDRGSQFWGFRFATPGKVYGSNTAGDWSLADVAEHYNRFLKNVIELSQADPITLIAMLSPDDVRDFQRGDYSRIVATTENGALNALIETIQLRINNKDLDFYTAEVSLRRLFTL